MLQKYSQTLINTDWFVEFKHYPLKDIKPTLLHLTVLRAKFLRSREVTQPANPCRAESNDPLS